MTTCFKDTYTQVSANHLSLHTFTAVHYLQALKDDSCSFVLQLEPVKLKHSAVSSQTSAKGVICMPQNMQIYL